MLIAYDFTVDAWSLFIDDEIDSSAVLIPRDRRGSAARAARSCNIILDI
jgi:hypothetical protein